MTTAQMLGLFQRRKTFDELVGIIREDKEIIKLPDRRALQNEQWFKDPMAELSEYERRRNAHDAYHRHIRAVAAELGGEHALSL